MEAQSALTTFEFNLSTKLSGIYTIPAGTQVSTGNGVIFQQIFCWKYLLGKQLVQSQDMLLYLVYLGMAFYQGK
nr:hypothetical protein [Escherichia coli]